MSHKFACFVTGTDTGVGKTLVSAALVHAAARAGLKAVGMKPVAAGSTVIDGRLANEDVDTLAAEASVAVPVSLTSPYILREACAPHVAAELERVRIDEAVLLDAFRQTSAMAKRWCWRASAASGYRCRTLSIPPIWRRICGLMLSSWSGCGWAVSTMHC